MGIQLADLETDTTLRQSDDFYLTHRAPNHPLQTVRKLTSYRKSVIYLAKKRGCMDEILTVKQSALELQIPERTLYQLIKDKRGPKAFRLSKKHIRLYRSDLNSWVQENEI